MRTHTPILYKMLPTQFQLTTPQHRNIRSITQDVKPFLNKIIFQYRNPLPVETEAHSIHTIPLIRGYLDSCLYYIRYKTLDFDILQNRFPITFNPLQNLILEHIIKQSTHKLIEYNENMKHPLYRPSHLESLRKKAIISKYRTLKQK